MMVLGNSVVAPELYRITAYCNYFYDGSSYTHFAAATRVSPSNIVQFNYVGMNGSTISISLNGVTLPLAISTKNNIDLYNLYAGLPYLVPGLIPDGITEAYIYFIPLNPANYNVWNGKSIITPAGNNSAQFWTSLSNYYQVAGKCADYSNGILNLNDYGCIFTDNEEAKELYFYNYCDLDQNCGDKSCRGQCRNGNCKYDGGWNCGVTNPDIPLPTPIPPAPTQSFFQKYKILIIVIVSVLVLIIIVIIIVVVVRKKKNT